MSLIRASYTVHRGQAYAGQIADTSLYNIDGACVASVKFAIGKLVCVEQVQSVEGHKVVSVAKDATKPILGVAVMSHAYSPTGEYEEGVAVNVMTHGRVWALVKADGFTDADAGFDKAVSFNAEGVIDKAGTIKTGYTFTGEVLPTTDAKYKIAKIQLIQSAKAPAATGG